MNAENEYTTIIKDIITQNKRYAGNEDLLEEFCAETVKRTKSVVSLLKDEEKVLSYVLRVSNSAVIKVLKDNNRLGAYRAQHPAYSTLVQSAQIQESSHQHIVEETISKLSENIQVEQSIQNVPVEEKLPAVDIQVDDISVRSPVEAELPDVGEQVAPETAVVEEEIVSEEVEPFSADSESLVSVDELPVFQEDDIEPVEVLQPYKDEVAPQVLDNHIEASEQLLVETDNSQLAESEDISSQSSDVLEEIASNLHVLNSQNPTKQYYMIYKLRYIDHMKNKDIAKNMNISEADVTSRLLELSDKLKKCFNQ